MNTNRRATFRPSALEALEDRAVPSAGATLQAQLTTIGARVDAAYAQFATSVRQAELTLVTPLGSNSAAPGTAVSVAVQVGQAATVLQDQVSTAVLGQPGTNSQALLSQQLTGSSPGSLLFGVAGDLVAASQGSVDGRVASANLPLLFEAVDGAISASLNTATIEIDLYASGVSSGGPSGSGSALNLAAYGTQANAAYAGFAADVQQALGQVVSPGGPTGAADASTAFGQQVQSLARSLGGIASGTSAAPRAAAIQGQFVGATPGNLGGQLSGLIAASTAESGDGSVPETSLPLLIAAVDSAVAASYDATSVEGLLLTLKPAASNGSGTGSGSGANQPVSFSTTGTFNSYGVVFER